MTRPYAEAPTATNLVSFVKRDSTHWRSASWRDSDAGYASGRFAMDVNAIWAPRALEAIATIMARLPEDRPGSPSPRIPVRLESWARHSAAISPIRPPSGRPSRRGRAPATISRWRSGPERSSSSVGGRLAALPTSERRYWEKAMTDEGEMGDSLTFLALSLDSLGRPIPVVNTDPATDLFLGPFATDTGAAAVKPGPVLADLEPFAARLSRGSLREWARAGRGERRVCDSRDLGAIRQGRLPLTHASSGAGK